MPILTEANPDGTDSEVALLSRATVILFKGNTLAQALREAADFVEQQGITSLSYYGEGVEIHEENEYHPIMLELRISENQRKWRKITVK